MKSLVDLLNEKIESCKTSIVEQWQNPVGTSTQHFVIDDVLPVEICEKIYQAFPKDGRGFYNRKSFREKKKTSANMNSYDPIIGEITYALQDKTIVDKISKLVGYEHIIPDPKLYAGGLSMMSRGDFLNPHIDNSHDAERKHYRRLNILYYVTPDWKIENGGNLELWDAAKKTPKTIVSACNRLVVMNTNKTSWHSVSPVLVDSTRCCVSNYYFSEISPDFTDYFHVTSFYGRPEEKLKRALSPIDNALRNIVSKTLKYGRGRHLVNQQK
jgi:Rps23 Pro-64 3,4-dihydroxylase Tpa1-like proline 4-hydroxylase